MRRRSRRTRQGVFQVDGEESAAPAPAVVLIVDDDPLNRRLLVRALKSEGHVTVEATNGVEALERLVADQPDVMLLDVLMPDLDGFGVLSSMKDLPGVANTPVVMISSLEDQEAVLRCIELGADDFLPKPADLAILRARLNAGLNKKRLLDLQRRQLRDGFARFLPEPVVDELMMDGGAPRISATRVAATVMFADLRGFTTFSESHEPDVVIDALNRYLTLMSDAVLDHGGTLVSYMGDGILAVFGAPMTVSDHADRAVAAAEEMVGPRLAGLNEWASSCGLDDFRMGIGLHAGSIMSGNVGSDRRLEYTVIGDTTNIAARVESMTKDFGVSLLATQEVVEALTAGLDGWTFVDEVAPRGRAHTVRLWTVTD